jgi:Domain of unknown function (DUF3510).
VDDVLTSVQKTEESLRRLKKIRDRSAATTSTEVKGVGDDDKIREQLLLDVYSYCKGVIIMCLYHFLSVSKNKRVVNHKLNSTKRYILPKNTFWAVTLTEYLTHNNLITFRKC